MSAGSGSRPTRYRWNDAAGISPGAAIDIARPGPLPSIACFTPRARQKGAARFLAALAEHEVAERGHRRIERHLTDARLPLGKTLSSFDFNAVPTISKAQIMALAAGDSWLANGANLLLFGPARQRRKSVSGGSRSRSRPKRWARALQQDHRPGSETVALVVRERANSRIKWHGSPSCLAALSSQAPTIFRADGMPIAGGKAGKSPRGQEGWGALPVQNSTCLAVRAATITQPLRLSLACHPDLSHYSSGAGTSCSEPPASYSDHHGTCGGRPRLATGLAPFLACRRPQPKSDRSIVGHESLDFDNG
jgi:hypothetical protein